jgi:hypothetical protein
VTTLADSGEEFDKFSEINVTILVDIELIKELFSGQLTELAGPVVNSLVSGDLAITLYLSIEAVEGFLHDCHAVLT